MKPELLRAIVDCGFEHPSEANASDITIDMFIDHHSMGQHEQVQHECIPQAILGTDVLCQAKPTASVGHGTGMTRLWTVDHFHQDCIICPCKITLTPIHEM